MAFPFLFGANSASTLAAATASHEEEPQITPLPRTPRPVRPARRKARKARPAHSPYLTDALTRATVAVAAAGENDHFVRARARNPAGVGLVPSLSDLRPVSVAAYLGFAETQEPAEWVWGSAAWERVILPWMRMWKAEFDGGDVTAYTEKLFGILRGKGLGVWFEIYERMGMAEVWALVQCEENLSGAEEKVLVKTAVAMGALLRVAPGVFGAREENEERLQGYTPETWHRALSVLRLAQRFRHDHRDQEGIPAEPVHFLPGFEDSRQISSAPLEMEQATRKSGWEAPWESLDGIRRAAMVRQVSQDGGDLVVFPGRAAAEVKKMVGERWRRFWEGRR